MNHNMTFIRKKRCANITPLFACLREIRLIRRKMDWFLRNIFSPDKRHILVISLKHFRHFKERTRKRNNNKVGLLHYKLMIKPWEMMFKKNVKWQKQINTQWSYFKNLGKMFHQTESSIIDDNVFGNYARSPRIRRANWMSFGMIVTRFAWIAHKFVSSNNPTK